MAEFAEEFDINSGANSAPEGQLNAIEEKIKEAVELQLTIDNFEEDIKAAKRALHNLKTQAIPDLMAEVGLDALEWQGWKVKVGDFVSGTLPSDPAKRAAAIKWLEDHEAGDIIKTTVKVDFGRSQHNEALAIYNELASKNLAPDLNSGVHPQTLQAFARERIKNGEDIDPDALGLFTGRIAKFEVKKR